MTAASCRVMAVDPRAPDPGIVKHVVQVLRRGSLVAFPTDTLYGISSDAGDASAVRRVADLKGYAESRPFVVLFDGSDAWLDRLAPLRSPLVERLRRGAWPGALTLVLAAGPGAPAHAVSAGGGIALRAPDHPLCQAIVRALGGPIVSTSANRRGEEPLRTAAEIARAFGAELDLVLDGGPTRGGLGSTIVDGRGARLAIVRQGELIVET